MNVDQPFARGDSLLHRADPRVKILSALLFCCTVTLLHQPIAATAAMLTGIMLLLTAGLRSRKALQRILSANAFLIVLWLLLPWASPGSPVLQWGPVVMTREGLRLSLLITLRCNAILLALLALLATSPLFALARAATQLRIPSTLTVLFVLTCRYLSLMSEEYGRLKTSAALRGFQPAANRWTYHTYANLMGMLFIRSHDRAQRIYQAMCLRGFAGRYPMLEKARVQARDILLLVTMLGVSITLYAIESRIG